MDQIYERTLSLLGKGANDLSLEQLSADIHEQPEVLIKNDHATEYLFRNNGFQISYYEHSQCFASVFFHFGSALAESGQVSRYSGNLPSGIEFGDSQIVVQQKLGMKPANSKMLPGPNRDSSMDLWEEYRQGLFELRFIFRGSTEKLSSVSVHYAPSNLPAKL